MDINCIVIDDEPLARKGLKEYIADVGFLNLQAEFDNPVSAMELLNKGTVQLLFLDIQMPKITGLDFFKTLLHPPPVIFTTAYPQYALEGFEVNALDYLVKPISFERFFKAAVKAREFYEVRQKNITVSSQENQAPDHFFIKTDNRLVKILFDELLFVEALQNYVMVHTKEKSYMTYLTFKSVEDYLPTDKFIKSHKSFIVSISGIDHIDGNEIKIGSHLVPISRNLKDALMDRIVKGKFLKR
ncbi:MAG: LytTR family DNA-binding domain-containing protein [Ferruginibacter sp.]